MTKALEYPTLSLEEILENHVALADSFRYVPVLEYFKEYLQHGYYPFFLEGIEDYLLKLNNVIEKVIFEDIAVVYNLKQSTLPTLKKTPLARPYLKRISS